MRLATRTLLTALPAFIAAVLMAAPAAAQGDEAKPDPKEALTGTWVYVGGKGQKAKMQKAIDDATDDMNFITRPIARSRLEDTNEAYRKITIDFPGDKITIKRDSQPLIASPASGAKAGWTNDGDDYKVTQNLKGKKIVQVFDAGDGKKTAIYALAKKEGVMVLTIIVYSPKLPKKVTYHLSYRKQ